jgi:predicted AlkP superfamily pyrophosphatase or phosphodiesterase
MKYFLFFLLTIPYGLLAQQKRTGEGNLRTDQPKLVIGIVVDQMRWDFLYRYQYKYAKDGGFNRLLKKGFSFDQTFIPYTPSVTGCGHATVFTGTVPGVHGITGNVWWDKHKNRQVYCSEDKQVKTVGGITAAGEMSPRNMLTTSVCDELKLATNFKSKVIGIAMKDRGSILPAGHSADAAYWYESKSGNWITSSYYMDSLPNWVQAFNSQKYQDKLYEQGWSLRDPADTYQQSTKDQNSYESTPLGKDQKGFPYNLSQFVGKNYEAILSTPQGNTFTFSFAKTAIDAEGLGADNIADFLTISFSSPDYTGHSFGPNSLETEDNYIRFDNELGQFMDYLDEKVGKNNYMLFLTADHGVAHVPAFLKEHKIPAGVVDDKKIMDSLNMFLNNKYAQGALVLHAKNYQLGLDHKKIDSLDLSKEDIIEDIISFVETFDGVDRVIDLHEIMELPLHRKIREMIANGWHPSRSGDLQIVFRSGWIDGMKTGTTHGLWNPYDTHIPLLWYGWKIPSGSASEEADMTDIAATVADLLHIQMPSGCTGKSLLPYMRKK